MFILRALMIYFVVSTLIFSCGGCGEDGGSGRDGESGSMESRSDIGEEGDAEETTAEGAARRDDAGETTANDPGRPEDAGSKVIRPPEAVPETLRIDPETGEILIRDGDSGSESDGGGHGSDDPGNSPQDLGSVEDHSVPHSDDSASDADRSSTDSDDSEPEQGRWRRIRKESRPEKMTPEQEAKIRELESIGYLSGSRPKHAVSGVVTYDTSSAYAGFNFYVSGHAPEAILTDMRGRVLHKWAYDFDKIWPDRDFPENMEGRYHWRRAYLFENGDILAIHESIGLIKLDKDSNLLWEYPGRCHHDLEVMDDGTIYVLARKARIIPRINETEPVVEDFIVRLDAEGTELDRVSILAAMENSEYAKLLRHMPDSGDILHTNTLEILDGRLAHKSPAFREGNALISILKVNVIAVIDLEAEVAAWAFRGRWRRQHQPTVLDNGRILLFDNGGSRAVNSRVIEFDPVTREIPWSYTGTHWDRFYSETCGSCIRLPNGNTLITESDNGRALEVTPDGTVVWEFISPHTAGEENELVATLFEVIRLDPDFPMDWLPER